MSGINRYKITTKGLEQAVKFLKTGKGHLSVPTWVDKYKADLKVKNGKVFFQKRELVSRENVEDYLRKRLYSKDADLQMARDSCHYQLLKETVGVTRRRLMDFLKAQKTLGETRSALPDPKSKGGKKIKGYICETDLVFIKKTDLVNCNPRFEKKHKPELSYALCTMEKATGLTRLDYVTTKEPAVVTPKVIEHIKWIAKKLKVSPKVISLYSDRGGEFDHAMIKPFVKATKFVPSGVSVERKNQQIQQAFYRILKNRQALTVQNGLRKAENQVNNCFNRIQKKTPLEAAEQKMDESIKKFNDKRGKYVSSDRRRPLEVGDHVRVQIKTIKTSGVGFKSYKNQTFTERVFVIKKKTKKLPHKYYVNGKWRLSDTLLKTNPRDEKSNRIIADRDAQQVVRDAEEEKRVEAEIEKNIAANRKRILALQKKGVVMPSVTRGIKNLEKIKSARKRMEKIDDYLDELQAEWEKKHNLVGKPKKRIKVEGWAPKDSGYEPDSDQPKPRKKRAQKKGLTTDQKKLKQLHAYVLKEERDYPSYDDLPEADQRKRLSVWNKNIAEAKALIGKGVLVKGVPKNFF